MEALGPKLRRQRRRLGLTLDELAGRTSISKPYLSLIETGRVPNPPSDEKLRRLEQTLGFSPGELVTQAHLYRTPRDVRAVLQKLMQVQGGKADARAKGGGDVAVMDPPGASSSLPLDLDDAYLSGVLHELVDRHAGNIETVTTNAVPVINKVSAGYPKDFTDLSYPKGAADDYVSCPDVQDKDAFAARIHGDSMVPKYREGDIVIFSPALSPRDGDDCFVRFDNGHTTFKRVFFESGEGGASILRLQPRNEKYRPQAVPSEQVSGLYKAVYKYQRVDEG
jgi:phage repressor protein C with HTH and peptisase S24 domain/transcriptional regulator with XRE-family HTH domain